MTRFGKSTLTVLLSVTLISTLQSQRSGDAPRTSPAGNGAFTFALIGDMPYGAEGDAKFPNVMAG